jgi:hypothetical protein
MSGFGAPRALAVLERVQHDALFAFRGAGSGGFQRVGATSGEGSRSENGWFA